MDILCCPEAVLGALADDAQCPADIAIDVEAVNCKLCLTLANKSVTAIVGFTETVGTGELTMPPPCTTTERSPASYRKRHRAIRRSVYSAGDESPVFTIGPCPFGIMICNDFN